MDYWKECIFEAFDDAKITATDEQVATVADWVEGAHENHGMATGAECIPNPIRLENDDLKRQLKREKDKQLCKRCMGEGRLVTHGPCHSSNSECYECRGEGFIYR